MEIKCYLALTAAEFRAAHPLPPRVGWMACHFSPYGTGLSNLPEHLPEGSMLILNDRTPISGHDPSLIAEQLTERVKALGCSCVLLDFERAETEESAQLVKFLSHALPCPVGISAAYEADPDTPVFLPPLPPDVPLRSYLAPWTDREVWLEAALNGSRITLTAADLQSVPFPARDLPRGIFQEAALHCHYCLELTDASAVFSLTRTVKDLEALLEEAAELGVTQSVGLWQELGSTFTHNAKTAPEHPERF